MLGFVSDLFETVTAYHPSSVSPLGCHLPPGKGFGCSVDQGHGEGKGSLSVFGADGDILAVAAYDGFDDVKTQGRIPLFFKRTSDSNAAS